MQSSRTKASAQIDLGNEWMSTGRFAEARICYQRAISLSPDFDTAYFRLGNLLYRADHLAEAERCFRQALALNSEHLLPSRWLQDRNDSPWYPEVVRLFRQERAGDWDVVVARVAAESRARFAGVVGESASRQ